jgi:hypothetical protein
MATGKRRVRPITNLKLSTKETEEWKFSAFTPLVLLPVQTENIIRRLNPNT